MIIKIDYHVIQKNYIGNNKKNTCYRCARGGHNTVNGGHYILNFTYILI